MFDKYIRSVFVSLTEKEENSNENDDERRQNPYRHFRPFPPNYIHTKYNHRWIPKWLRNWREHHAVHNFLAQHNVPRWRPVRPTPTESRDREGPLDFKSFIAKWQEEVETCGQQEVQPHLRGLRVIGGLSATRGSWPWMVRSASPHRCPNQSVTCFLKYLHTLINIASLHIII